MTTRRQLLSRAAWSAVALSALPLAACAQEAHETPPRSKPAGAIADPAPLAGTLLTRPVPATGELLPVIGVGTSAAMKWRRSRRNSRH